MMAFALTIGAQAQQEDGGEYQPSGMDAMFAAMIAAKIHQDSIDTSSLVAVYDYECQTQDADGKAASKREQSDAFISSTEREQTRRSQSRRKKNEVQLE